MTPPSPQQWARLQKLFGECLDLGPEERDNFAIRAAGGDSNLLHELRRLLAAHENPNAYLDREIPRIPFLVSAPDGQIWRAGDSIGDRFRIVELLGRGGMGEVYEAEDLELKTRIAIKTVRPEIAGDEKMRDRFRQEILLARRVTHPNVCRIFDVGTFEQPGMPSILYLTMELLEGETLADRLARGVRYTPREAKPIAVQMAQALDAAHDAGVVHRDFKAANVMLVPVEGGTDRTVITDFGHARAAAPGDTSTATVSSFGGAIGTPAYMAPEQIEGKPAGAAADVYALGVVLYEMVAGRRPFEESNPLALAARKVREPPPPPGDFAPGLDARWQAVILRCLEIDPSRRFVRMRHVMESLEGSQPWRIPWRLRRPSIRAIASILAVFLVSAWVWLAFRPRDATLSGEVAHWYAQGIDSLHAGASWRAGQLLEKVTSLAPNYAPAHARLAEAYIELDMSDRARDELLKASQAAPDRSRLPASDALEIDAANASVLREFDKASVLYAKLADSSPAAQKPGYLLDVGRSRERAGQTNKAIETYEGVRMLSPQSAAAQLRLAILYGRKEDLARAGPLFDQAQASYKLSGDFEGVAEVLLQRARTFRNSRKIEDAQTATAEALQLARTTGNKAQEIRAELETSLNELFSGRADQATRQAGAALDLARQENLEWLLIQGFVDLGNSHLTQYHLKEAEENLRQALAIAQRTKSLRGEAFASAALASTLERAADPAQSLALLVLPERFYRNTREEDQLATVMTMKAEALRDLGQLQAAKATLLSLVASAEARNDTLHVAQLRDRLAGILAAQGDLPKAVEVYSSAESTYRQLGRTPNQLYAKTNRADLLCRLGRFREGLALLDQVSVSLRPLGDGGSDLAVRVAIVRGEQAIVARDFRSALAIARPLLTLPVTGSKGRNLQLQEIAGLSEANLSAGSGGASRCASALAAAIQVPKQYRLDATLAVAAAANREADYKSAASLAFGALRDSEQLGLEELSYRAALLARFSARSLGDPVQAHQAELAVARHASALTALWGNDAMTQYQIRPDIQFLRHKEK